MKVTAIDFETANSSPASVCAVGLSVLEDGLIEPVLETLIRPEKNVSAFYYGNIRIHGIRPQDVVHAPDFAQVYRQMKPYLDGSLMAAHNARFDEGCLKAVFRVYQMDYPGYRFYDTLTASRRQFGHSLPNHQLHTVAAACGYDLQRHHHALADAEACAAIALYLL